MRTCGKINACFCIAGIYKLSWNYVICVTSHTNSFRVYNFSGISALVIWEHIEHALRSLYGILPCIVQHNTFCRHENVLLYTCLLYLYFPPEWVLQYLGIYHNNFQCGIPVWLQGQVHNADIATSTVVLWIWQTWGLTEFLYVSKFQLNISPDLLFCALWLWLLICFRWRSHHVNKEECILLVFIQYSQPQITLYRVDIFFSWGGRMLRSVCYHIQS